MAKFQHVLTAVKVCTMLLLLLQGQAAQDKTKEQAPTEVEYDDFWTAHKS